MIQIMDNRSPLYLMNRSSHQVALALRVSPPLSRVGPGGIACSALLA